ncbi:hypothetical protein Hanom_Chr14g01315491 [Helianthus anomalus]
MRERERERERSEETVKPWLPEDFKIPEGGCESPSPRKETAKEESKNTNDHTGRKRKTDQQAPVTRLVRWMFRYLMSNFEEATIYEVATMIPTSHQPRIEACKERRYSEEGFDIYSLWRTDGTGDPQKIVRYRGRTSHFSTNKPRPKSNFKQPNNSSYNILFCPSPHP